MDQRAAGLGGRHHVDDGWQRLPVHRDAGHRVLGARGAVGDDHGHDLADVPGAVAAERVLRGLAEIEGDGRRQARRRRAEQGQRLQPGGELGEGEDRGHAWHRPRRLDVEPGDPGVGVRRAEERGVEQARQGDVVDEAALAAQESWILPPPDGGAEVLRAHEAG